VSNLLKKEKGFTLIEIVLVLAIAGLLLVIVFLAVSGAQKSRRDTQRKNDLSRIAANVESFASNNNGCYPDSAAAAGCTGTPTWANFVASTYWLDAAGKPLFTDPLSGTVYNNANSGALAAFAGNGPASVLYTWKTGCSATVTGDRIYSVHISLEQGNSCRDNH
jgi:prepilin-type N-terminal cleavage/methylation domain-containing protein